MLTYSPLKLAYPGDEHMRAVTSVARANRGEKRKAHKVTLAQFKKAKRYTTSRLCGNLEKLCDHVSHKVVTKKSHIYAWCGKPTYVLCSKCKDDKGKSIPLHYNAKAGEGKGLMCFYLYHDNRFFGLGKLHWWGS